MRSRLPQMLWGSAFMGRGSAKVFQTTLDNGLTVLIEENHANPVVAVEVFVRTGSIYEQEYWAAAYRISSSTLFTAVPQAHAVKRQVAVSRGYWQ